MHSEFWAQFLIALAEIYIFCFLSCWNLSCMLKLKLYVEVEVICWSWSWSCILKLKLHVEVEVDLLAGIIHTHAQFLFFMTDIIHMHAQILSFCSWLKFLLLWLTSYISMLKFLLLTLTFRPGAERIAGELHPAGGPRPWSMLCMCTHAPHGPARPREHAAHARTRPLTPKVDILTTGGGRISYRAHI